MPEAPRGLGPRHVAVPAFVARRDVGIAGQATFAPPHELLLFQSQGRLPIDGNVSSAGRAQVAVDEVRHVRPSREA